MLGPGSSVVLHAKMVFAGALLGAALHAQAGRLAARLAALPPLRVTVSPRQAFAPLRLVVALHQDPAAVAGMEVCVAVIGPEDFLSCWTFDDPPVLVNRTFTLTTTGDYEVFAVGDRTGKSIQSNHLAVKVVGVE